MVFGAGSQADDDAAAAASLAREIAALSQASRCLTKDEVERVLVLGELGKEVCRERCMRLLQEAGPRVVLMQYQGDGTPQLVRRRHSVQMSEGKQVVSDGGSGCEFLCQIAFLSAESAAGEILTAAVVHEPRVLDGKTSWHFGVLLTA